MAKKKKSKNKQIKPEQDVLESNNVKIEEVKNKEKLQEQENKELLEELDKLDEAMENTSKTEQKDEIVEQKEEAVKEDSKPEVKEEPVKKVKTHTAEVETIKEKQVEIKAEEEKRKQAEEKTKQAQNEKKVFKKSEEEPKKEETAIVTQKEKAPDYVQDPKKKFRALKITVIFIIVLCIIGLLFSTIFALLDFNNTKIGKNIEINGISVSDKTQEEARTLLRTETDTQLSKKIKLVYGDYSRELDTKEIDFKYMVDEGVTNAYNLTRKGNIFKNNFEILKTYVIGEKLQLTYQYDNDALQKIIADLAVNIPGLVKNPSYYIEEDGLYVEKGKDGIKVETEELKQQILDNILSRKSNMPDEMTISIPVKNVKAEEINVEKILSEIKKEPKDAYYETEPEFKIYREENGVDFAVSIDEAQKIIKDDANATTEEDGVLEYRIPLKITPANRTINDIGMEAFPYEIVTFTTRYDETNYNRTNNLEIATDKIDGTVLMPGEIFSYNQVVGKRTIEEGYRNAKIYENGQVVDGLAGGICQVSSTLYNAALLSDLEIIERHNHSFTTSYLPAGRDATVVYGVKDLKFQNNRSYPIKISGSLESGILRFTINGIKEEDEVEVKLYSTTIRTIPYSEKVVVDYSLDSGDRVVKQYGHAGSQVNTRMEKYVNGELVYDEVITSDVYDPMQTIIHVGP